MNISYGANEFSWPPPISISYDLTDALTAYVGYTDIYQSQANRLDADLRPLPPVTGANWEGGLKWAAKDGKLNLSLAAYRIEQEGFGAVDPPDYSEYVEVSPGVYCCFVVDPDRTYMSQGIDFEATGEVLPGWQVAGSYTYNDRKLEGPAFGSNDGQPFRHYRSEHLYKLWTSYDFGAAGHQGWFANLTVSAGVNGQSAGYASGSICVNLTGAPDPITGSQPCASYAPPDYVRYNFTVDPYAVFSARLDYRINDRFSASFYVENLADKTYYQTTSGGVASGHWYGTPRSFTATLRAEW